MLASETNRRVKLYPNEYYSIHVTTTMVRLEFLTLYDFFFNNLLNGITVKYIALFMIEFQPSDLESFILCSYKSALDFTVLVPENSKVQIFFGKF